MATTRFEMPAHPVGHRPPGFRIPLVSRSFARESQQIDPRWVNIRAIPLTVHLPFADLPRPAHDQLIDTLLIIKYSGCRNAPCPPCSLMRSPDIGSTQHKYFR